MTNELDILRAGCDEVAPGVHAYMVGNTSPNSTIVMGGGEVMLIDALMTTRQSAGLRDAVSTLTADPVTRLIYTHRHGDHILGAELFAETVHTVFASASTVEFVRTMQNDFIPLFAAWRRTPQDERDVLAVTKVVLPNVAVERVASVFVGETEVRMITQTLAHSPSDMLVLLPAHGVLCTGDIWSPRIVPGVRDGRTEGWIARLEEIYDMDPDVLMPGHGPWTRDRFYVRELRDFLAVAWDATQKGAKAGKGVRDILADIDLTAWSQFHGMNRYPEVIERMLEENQEHPSKYDAALAAKKG
jgi:cyclase